MKDHNDPTELTMVVSSPAFGANGSIPTDFTPMGSNIAPPLAWTNVPEGTKSIVIICEDPDAPGRIFTHWIVVGIPPEATSLDPAKLPATAALGLNDRGQLGWTGPNPPSGRHRYFFKVFALDINLEKPGLDKPAFYSAIQGHILARGELIGTYEKGAPDARNQRSDIPAGHGAQSRNR
jgi:Raf kinase inhibitor-like YbhB/YbcL family protein